MANIPSYLTRYAFILPQINPIASIHLEESVIPPTNGKRKKKYEQLLSCRRPIQIDTSGKNRNHSCSCGSGIKYKKCCLKTL